MNYTFYFPLPAYYALSLVIRLKATIGGPQGTLLLCCLTFPSEKVIAGLEDNEE